MKALSKPSQNQRILEYLKANKSITALDAQREFGCMRLAARIAELEKCGHKFTRQRVTARNRYGERANVTAYGLMEGGKS